MYVIRRDSGGYVAVHGSRYNYTRDLAKARTFPTLEAAQAECCPGNEVPVPLDALIPQPER